MLVVLATPAHVAEYGTTCGVCLTLPVPGDNTRNGNPILGVYMRNFPSGCLMTSGYAPPGVSAIGHGLRRVGPYGRDPGRSHMTAARSALAGTATAALTGAAAGVPTARTAVLSEAVTAVLTGAAAGALSGRATTTLTGAAARPAGPRARGPPRPVASSPGSARRDHRPRPGNHADSPDKIDGPVAVSTGPTSHASPSAAQKEKTWKANILPPKLTVW